MTAALIETSELTKRFGGFTALDRCSLRIGHGEVFGLLGPNGAGKSTLIRLLLGFMSPSLGWARIDGLDCHRDQVAVHGRLSYLPGDARLFRTMNGWQVLRFFSQVRPDGNYARAVQIAKRLDLNLSRWVSFMSTGMRQKLALTVALAIEQPLLILDEPTANLDPTVRGEVLKMVLEAKRAGRTVVFSSHVLSEIEEVCDRVGILRAGKLVHEQCMSELKRQHRIIVKSEVPLAAAPQELANGIEVESLDGARLRILVSGNLSDVLRWLVELPLEILLVQPEGLRASYERFHCLVDEAA